MSLETIMSTNYDKTVKYITHHVPRRQMIYTKKQIGWNHENRYGDLLRKITVTVIFFFEFRNSIRETPR
jgi:hypothetical protein